MESAVHKVVCYAVCLLIGFGMGSLFSSRPRPPAPIRNVDFSQPFTIREGPGPVTTFHTHSVVVGNRLQHACEPGEWPVYAIAFENGRVIVSAKRVQE